MVNTSWLKQAKDQPLFPDMLWSQPQNKRHAGKLLIIGGHGHSFNEVSSAYSAAQKAGAGSLRVILPASLEKLLGKSFPEAEFAPSTPSESFGQAALAQMDDAAAWADGVLLAGDFGHNSETAVLLEKFISKYQGRLTLSGDSLDYFLGNGGLVTARTDTLIAAPFSKLQKLASNSKPPVLLRHDMGLPRLVEALRGWQDQIRANIMTVSDSQLVAAVAGRAVTTPSIAELEQLAAYASVWWLQQPAQPLEAMASAVYLAGA